MVRNPIHEPFIHEVTSHQDRDVRLKSSARTVHGKPRVGALRSFPVQIPLPSFWKRSRASYTRRAPRQAVTAPRLSPSWKHCLGDFWNTMRTFKSSGKGFHFSRQKCLLIVAQVQSCFFLVCRKSVGLPFRHETRTATNPSFWGVTKLDCPKAFFSQLKRNPNLHSTHDSFFARALHLEKANP